MDIIYRMIPIVFGHSVTRLSVFWKAADVCKIIKKRYLTPQIKKDNAKCVELCKVTVNKETQTVASTEH